MPTDLAAMLRDGIVLAYMIFLRVGAPLLVIWFVGKWIQRKMSDADMHEQRVHLREPYCWDKRNTAQTQRAKTAAAAHPDLPCWLAVQQAGEGVTEACFNCPRYALQETHPERKPVEVG